MKNEDAEAVVSQIIELVHRKLLKYYQVEPSQIQVLTPMQKGVVGATNLNLSLQESLNPAEHEVFIKGRAAIIVPKECLRRSGFAFRKNDKVMQVKNNYDKEVFNGDIGIIESVSMENRNVKVNFEGRSIEYDITDLDELVHAYATTIHKAQGSEYPIVVMPILMNHLIYHGLNQINWAGFYLFKNEELVLGPFKGNQHVCISAWKKGYVERLLERDKSNVLVMYMNFQGILHVIVLAIQKSWYLLL